MEVLNVKINDANHNLIIDGCRNTKNKYTLLIGENGSGKTECLVQIINTILHAQVGLSENKYEDNLYSFLDNKYKSELVDYSLSSYMEFFDYDKRITINYKKSNSPREIKTFTGDIIRLEDENYRYESEVICNNDIVNKINPINIISITESPYNKFPYLQSEGLFKYHHVGRKTEDKREYLSQKEDDYVNPKIEQLSKSIFGSISSHRKSNFNELLKTLSFSGKFNFTLRVKGSYKYSFNSFDEFSKRIIDNLKNHEIVRFSSVGKQNNIDEVAVTQSLIKLNNYYPNLFSPDVSSFLRTKDFNFTVDLNESNSFVNDIGLLIEVDAIYVSSIDIDTPNGFVNAGRLSSGQLCLLNIIFGIASKIEDNTLVLIDEPEISLHPFWQSKFISLIHETFKNYNQCHFIIATHSPHIVSNLNDDSYVVIIDKKSGKSTTEVGNSFNFKSVDYQLAEVFGYPGNKNEYLNRELMTFLVEISENKTISNDTLQKVKKIIELKDKLSINDPIRKLIDIAKGVLEEVAE